MNRAFKMFCLLMVTFGTLLTPVGAEAAPPPIDTNAAGAALIDVESGRILYSEKGDQPMRIASLTKVMTAIVAIDHGNLSDVVKVSKNAYRKEGSSIYLKLGEEMSLQNLLYGLMLRSGNDAATAIAEHIGGSVEGFVFMMNDKARLLGMSRSQFTNPSGLDEGGGNFASANDMAKLTAYALNNPVFQDIVKTKMKKVPNPNESWDYTWFNKNKMLSIFEGADGVKTGYTKLAKRCLISSATRGNQQLAVVTLDDRSDWADHARLLQYGFQNYPLQKVVGKEEAITGTDWVVGRSFQYPLLQGEAGLITKRVVPTEEQTPSYRLGDRGSLQILLDGKTIGALPLYQKGSPRLLAEDKSTFGFQQSESYRATGMSPYLSAVKMLVHKLFTPWLSIYSG
jgi:serine-type D-Ala-D-Ala carboxypeptidase (penicillin-binding protein 5/6)